MRRLREFVPASFLIAIGSATWAWTMVKSGWPTSWGLGFWGANGHDGIWHLALIESIKRGFPINNPIFSGVELANYNWGFDLLAAVVSRISGLAVSLLYFQLLPPLLAVAIGVLSYLLIKRWTGSRAAARWATFFTYFGGSFGWLVTLWRSGEIGGESLFWAQQSISTLINPPFALSLVFLTAGLYLVLREKHPGVFSLTAQVFLFGFLFIVKSYAGIIGLVGLVTIGFWQAFYERRSVGLVRLGAAAVITGLLVTFLAPKAGGVLVVEPFWFTRTMIEATDRLFVPRLAEALGTYISGGVLVKAIAVEMGLTIIFVVGNLGSRILSFLVIPTTVKKGPQNGYVGPAIAAMFFASMLLPLVFVQKGTAWNTIQFFYYGEVFAGWMAGVVVARWQQKASRPLKSTVILLLVLLTVPTSLSALFYQYIPPRPPTVLPFSEMAALAFLRGEPAGTVLTYPYEKKNAEKVSEPPVPLYRYSPNAYVAAYSGQPSFVSDSINLDILGIDGRSRLNGAESFFEGGNEFLAMRFLRDNHIAYIYLNAGERLPGPQGVLGVSMVYSKDGIKIYRVEGI